MADIWVTQPSQLLRLDEAGVTQASVNVNLSGLDRGSLAFGAGSVWVQRASNSIARINPSTATITANITLSGGTSPYAHSLAFDDATNSLWAGDGWIRRIIRINPVTNTIDATVSIPGAGDGAHFVATGEGAVWAAQRGSNVVHRINPATNSVVASISVPSAYIYGLAVAGGRVWVADTNGSKIRFINPVTNTLEAAQIQTGYGPGFIVTNSLIYTSGELWWTINSSSAQVAQRGTVTDPIGVANQFFTSFNRSANETNAITFDGTLVWAAQTNGTILRFNQATGLMTTPVTGLSPGFDLKLLAISGSSTDVDPSDVYLNIGAIGDAEIFNAQPTARFTVTPNRGMVPLTVRFDGSSSTNSDGTAVESYLWDFGDGTSGTGRVIDHLYQTPGVYTASLTVEVNGGSDSHVEQVDVGEYSPQPYASTPFTEAVRYSHRAITRCELITPAGDRYMLPVVDGTLTIDRRNQVWRTADLTLGLDQIGTVTRASIERLNVLGSDIALYSGLYFENDSLELVQVARLRVQTFERRLSAASIQVAGSDYASMLEEHPLTADYTNRLRGLDLVSAVTLLVTDSLPFVMPGMVNRLVVGDGIPAWQVPFDATFDGDNRLDTIVSWCEAAGVYFFNLPNGTFYLRSKTDFDDPVLTVSDGVGGVLIDANEAFSRLELYNAVSVTFDAPEGVTTPVRAFVVDDDPASPTYWSGPFGRRVKQVSGVPAKTNAEAQVAAIAKLNEAKGINRGLRITGLRYPTLIPGDTIDVELPNESSEQHVIEAVTHNLSGATVEIETRFVQ